VRFDDIKTKAKTLQNEVSTLYYAARDPRTPWYAKVFVIGIAAYALSPIDLIPDFVPVLGYLDDMLLLPLGIYLALKMLPPEVLSAARAKARRADGETPPHNWRAAAAILALWMGAGALLVYLVLRWVRSQAPDSRLGY